MLKVKKLSLKNNLTQRNILEDINLEINENEIHCILGKNGSGKTSLAQALMGINADLISSGQILFFKKNITEKSISERSKLGMTMAFQEPARFEGLSVEKFLLLSSKNKKTKIEKILKLLNLNKEILKRKLDDKLSGGERKRIEIASVALNEPKLMILDEPDASLDIVVYNEFYDLLLKLKKEIKCSILLITHREEAGLISDKATLIEDGKVVTSGKFRAVMLKYCKRSKIKKSCMIGRKLASK
jgi:Fe-S cluster assembly ATP-binding protein